MRVLALTARSDRSELALLQGVARAGVPLLVLGELPREEVSDLLNAGASYHELHCRSRFSLSAVLAMRRHARAFGPTIVHAFTGRTLSNALLAFRYRPYRIVTYRGTCGHLSRFDPSSRLSFLSTRVDAISCVSCAVKDYLQTVRVPHRKLHVIYKGHRTEWYRSADRPALSQFGIPAGALVVGCVANMRPVKGIPVLLEAARMLASRLPQLHVLLIGEMRGETLAEFQRNLSNLHCPGYLENAASYSGACDIFVMPSLEREGLPKAVIEAMAQGVPAVVSKAGGMPELVRHMVDGMVVSPGSSSELASALQYLHDHPEQRIQMGAQAKVRIETGFTIEGTIDKTLRLYRELIDQTNGPE